MRFPCTFSRVTGWPCGVAHAPLALLRLLPHCTPDHTIEQRGRPLFVVMLRNPWDRFVSEWKSWGGYRLNTLDWSAVALPSENTSFPFYNNTRVRFHPAVPRRERATLEDLVALPAEFMLHNRCTKMIGGERREFNFNFSRANIGSRWIGLTSSHYNNGSIHFAAAASAGAVAYPGTMRLQHDKALQNFQRATNVLPLVQERFGESLCVLEVILGSLQKFSWEEKNHSHGATIGAYVGSRKKTKLAVSSSTFSTWAAKNTDDLLLYNHTLKIFDVQLRSALRFLQSRVVSRGDIALRQINEQQPHCVELDEWRLIADEIATESVRSKTISASSK
jgi:hypothetical protein